MKICVSSRQSAEYLKKADEFMVQYRDIEQIFDLFEKYSSKNVILECNSSELDWNKIRKFNILSKKNENHLILRLRDWKDIKIAIEYGIESYWGYPISSFDELSAVMTTYGDSAAPAYIFIGAPLVHSLDRLSQISKSIPIRVLANVAYTDGFPRSDGVLGGWVRPEDLAYCETFGVMAIEFGDCDQKKEQALFKIYDAESWTGHLGLIITGLNHPGVNRMIPAETAQMRYRCGQHCLSGLSCKICYRMLDLANPDLIKEYRDKKTTIDF